MNIIASAKTIDPWAPVLLVLGLIIIATVSAALLGVFRPRSIAGPQRVGPEEPLQSLMGIAMVGLMAWLFIAGFLGQIAGGPYPTTTTATSSPSTKADDSTPQPAQIAADVVARLAAVAVMVGLNQTIMRPPAKLGFQIEQLPGGALRGAVGFGVVAPLVLLSLMGTEWTLEAFHHTESHIHVMLKMLGESETPGSRALILFSVLIIAPISEEMFFRGFIQTILVSLFARFRRDKIGSAAPRWIPVLLTSLLFALAHPWWSWPPIFVLALCLGYAYERTGNLWAPIAIHALFNATSVVIYQTTAS